ncbi:uncharacterized protein LOC144093901 [Amblyomma americanum]
MSRTPKAAAGPNQLREELRQQLLTTFAANKREPAMEEGTQSVEDSSPAASGEPSKKQPLTVVSATSCGCHKYDDMHVHVTVLCPCSRPTTTDRATQTDMARTDEQQRSTPRGAGISVDHLQTSNERVFSQTCSHELGASVPNGTPVTLSLQGTPNSAHISVQAFEDEGNVSIEDGSKEEGHPAHPVFNGADTSRISPADRRRSVHEALARVRDTLFEALRDTPRAMAATSRAAIFESVFPAMPTSTTPSPPTAQPLSSLLRAHAGGDSHAIVNSILDPIAEEEEGIGARSEARRMIISEEMTTIFEHIESRWTKVCDQLRVDLNGRYNQFLEDCRTCLKTEQGGCERDQLRHEMAEARRELIADMKENFRTACEAFEDWRERYLQRELQASCTQLHQGDRFRVLSAVLRLEILDSLPELATRTRERAAALWKELLELWGPDVDALFNEEL